MSRGHKLAATWMIAVLGLTAGRSVAVGDDVNLAERANRVRQMTAEDRARLQKNIETFRQLPAEEQAAYRHLSEVVESDPGLKQLMATYTAWLQTLTPGQREELRLEHDINKRRDLVERFRKEQIEKEEMPLPELETGGRNPWQAPTLESSELLAVLDLVKNALPEDRKARLPEARDEIGRLEQAWAIAGNLWRPPWKSAQWRSPSKRCWTPSKRPPCGTSCRRSNVSRRRTVSEHFGAHGRVSSGNHSSRKSIGKSRSGHRMTPRSLNTFPTWIRPSGSNLISSRATSGGGR